MLFLLSIFIYLCSLGGETTASVHRSQVAVVRRNARKVVTTTRMKPYNILKPTSLILEK
jgi:hypothetical protein